MKKFILIDRDGVINKHPAKSDYVKSWEEFKFLPGAIEGLKLLTDHDYQIIIITNQAGIARKMMSEFDLKEIHENMKNELIKHGIRLEAIYYCPHGWDDNCNCRKPKPGMLLKASLKYNFDLTKTFFIGDDKRDDETAKNAKCKFIHMQTDGNLFKVVKQFILKI